MTAISQTAFPIVQRVLGESVRRLRTEHRLSQKRLADVAAIDVRHVQRIEAGRANPGLTTLCLLARALGTTPAFLIAMDAGGDPVPASEPA